MKKILLTIFALVIIFGGLVWADLTLKLGIFPFMHLPMQAISASMEPTIKTGDTIEVALNKRPKTLDVISFKCLGNKCSEGNTNLHPDETLIKRLIKIDDRNCYWVEGDNRSNSWDSRNFGWVCPAERSEVVVVKGK